MLADHYRPAAPLRRELALREKCKETKNSVTTLGLKNSPMTGMPVQGKKTLSDRLRTRLHARG